MVKKLIKKYQQLIKYIVIGCIAAGSDMILFVVLNSALKIPVYISNFLSVSAGITISFLLNRYFTFKVLDKLLDRYRKFYAIGLIGYLVSTPLIYIISSFSISEPIAKGFTIFVVFVIQYNLNRTISFK